MGSILNENFLPFKVLEENVYDFVCEIGREITKIILESYDRDLAKDRDKSIYRDRGPRKTTIKTVYGEVTYSRNVYETKTEEGETAFVFLLDQEMHMDKIGLISTNLAEKICKAVIESPFRKAAEAISGTCGQTISHGGAWNVVQQLGERISKEEDAMVSRMEAGQAEGEREIPALFEEMDGVWLKMQGQDHKQEKGQEMKVCTLYEGWDAESKDESRLVNKKMLAGMEKGEEFNQKREALIEKEYDSDEIGQRILNGDGGNWIKEDYDPEAIVQLDRFHIYQAIRKNLTDKEAQKAVIELFESQKLDEMLDYIQTYADSVESDDPKDHRSRDARRLYKYLEDNRSELLPYQDRGIKIPDPEEGVVYKNMGVQENQNCTLITLRMKNGRMRWSKDGANNLAKILYRNENGELSETIERFTDGLIFNIPIEEAIQTLSAAKAPKSDGKGSIYPEKINCHMPMKDAIQSASVKAFTSISEY